ncbi:MAG TPA: hypothetical protein VGU20_06360 [Stellaceae bacterium]|nr:hypothetical protein [Stellaceae bacterium]
MRIVVVFAPLVLAACIAAPSRESGTPVAANWSCGTTGLLGNSSAVERCAFAERDGGARVAAAPAVTPSQSSAQPTLRDDETAAAGRESAGTSQARRGSLFSGRQDVGTAGALDMIRTIAPLR